MKRRRFLGAVGGGLAFGTTGITAAKRKSDGVEIPIIVRGDEVVLSRTVERDWWNYVERVRKKRTELAQKYEGKLGVKDVNITLSDNRTVGGRRATQVNLDVHPGQFSERLPDEVDGVGVTTSEAKEDVPTACQNRDSFPNMPGGVITNAEDSGTWSSGTSCGRVYSETTNEYSMMTAAHLFHDNCNSTYGDTAYQDRNEIGTVGSESLKDDFALIKDGSSTRDFTNEVMVVNDQRATIDGAATNYEYLMENYTTIEKTGISSGYNGGYMQKKNAGSSGCITLNDKGVQIAANQAAGDSGGPMYVRMDDSGSETVGIVGIATLGVDSTGNTVCNGAEEYHHAKGFSSDGMSDYSLVWGK